MVELAADQRAGLVNSCFGQIGEARDEVIVEDAERGAMIARIAGDYHGPGDDHRGIARAPARRSRSCRTRSRNRLSFRSWSPSGPSRRGSSAAADHVARLLQQDRRLVVACQHQPDFARSAACFTDSGSAAIFTPARSCSSSITERESRPSQPRLHASLISA
jgi:hypothetical protein